MDIGAADVKIEIWLATWEIEQENRTKEEIMERFYSMAAKLDISPEELAGVPWPLLEQMLFPRIWTEEDFEDKTSEATKTDEDETSYVFESGHMGVA